jgi:tetratricopeptide (TPR) repeat protein
VHASHIVVAGNGSDGELRHAAIELEVFRDVLRQMFPSQRLASPVPATVVLFGDDASFARFKPVDQNGRRVDAVVGYFMPLADTNYIVANVHRDGAFSLEVAFHEYTHYLLEQNSRDIPLWFNEGVADYYSTFRVEPATGLSVIGTPPASRVAWLRSHSLLPLETLLSTSSAIGLFQTQDRATFYAQSWALVHYLTLGNDGRRHGQLDAYLNNLERGLPIDRAFKSAFDCGYGQLEQELRQYIRSPHWATQTVRVDAGLAPETASVEPMAEADAGAMLADMLVRARAREAEGAIADVLALDPSHPQARLSQALLRLQQQREIEAIDELQALAGEDATSFSVHLHLASALMAVGRGEEAARAAEHAVALNSESPSAWFCLAEAAAVSGAQEQADRAMARLQQLRANPDRYRQRAEDLFRLGLDAAAVRDAHAFLDRVGWSSERAPRAALVAALAHRRLGQTSEADDVLRRIRAFVRHGSWTESVLDYFQARLTAGELLSRAKDDAEKTEAHTFVGLDDERAGRRDEALSHLGWVRKRGVTASPERAFALGALSRLEKTTGLAK